MSVRNLFDLTGKVALVTGGSRGLGREMVLAFAESGADVVIASRKLDTCEALAKEVRERFGRRAMPYACHVGQWKAVEQLAEAAYAEFGKVDVLVNNAGMSPTYGDNPADVTEELWDKVHGVNLKGPFRLAAVVGNRMAQGAGGSILNISTTGAVFSYPGMMPYHAAKAGMNNMTLAFAKAFAPKVRVNCIMPGGMATDIAKHWDMEHMEREVFPKIPLKRIGRADEIVGAALYFASDASSYCTGAIIPVDGGDLISG
ncbi:MAG: SDR family NAD(P)-dependent oxidoreductase [Gammaproteobacteria bacterium]